MTSSLYWEKGKIQIDFLPKDKIEKFLNGNRNISTALPLPKRFIQEFLASVELEDKNVSKLSSEEKEKLKVKAQLLNFFLLYSYYLIFCLD